MRLGLLGKKYNDTKLVINGAKINETNECLLTETRLGGMFNIASANIQGIDPICYVEGEKDAVIIEDLKNSTRSSFVSNEKEFSIKTNRQVTTRHPDWIHVMYVDDIKSPHRVTDYANTIQKYPCSIDFCTDVDRKKYENVIQRADLVFDSKERKHLYKNVKTATPIVFHDPHGCEVVIIGRTSYEFKINPIKNLRVNGAGDIFAAYFIREYYNHNLKAAAERSCVLTTEHLVRRDING